MNTTKICLDHKQYTSKPEGYEAGEISNRIASQIKYLKRSNLTSVITNIGAKGQTFCPSTFKNQSRKKENFEQTRFFVLDFDGGLTLQEVINRAERYDLPMLFAYETFSSLGEGKSNMSIDRFRVVFMNDIPITDIRVAQIMIDALLIIFPEADPTSKDISKMYYGGKKVLYLNQSLFSFMYTDEAIPSINIESLTRNMTHYLLDKKGITHYKKELEKFARNHGISRNKKGLLDISRADTNGVNSATEQLSACGSDDSFIDDSSISGDSSDNSNICKSSPFSIIVDNTMNGDILHSSVYRINMDSSSNDIGGSGSNNSVGRSIDVIGSSVNVGKDDESLTSSTTINNADKITAKTPPRTHNDYRSSVLNEIGGCCKLYNEFESGTRILNYNELYGICSNIVKIESGIKKFLNILEQHSYYDDRSWRYQKWKKDLNYTRDKYDNPQSCNSFCPYKDECPHSTNILSTVKPKYRTMEKIPNHKEVFYPLNVVVNDVKDKIMSAILSHDIKYHIIKAQTAIGKSSIIYYIMKNSDKKFLIVVPTNLLKDEQYVKAINMGVEIFKTCALPTSIDNKTHQKIH
ncbi:MAG: hypothetical protein FWD97_02925 [Defluviitaleaceae bacterium]|nr:hypothetical protein [Defluviitaleaceae bacterium]